MDDKSNVRGAIALGLAITLTVYYARKRLRLLENNKKENHTAVKPSPHQLLLQSEGISKFDSNHVIHPYTLLNNNSYSFPVIVSASGCKLKLENGEEVIDGISSWWCALHGYRNQDLNDAIKNQIDNHMSHSMFGGLTHPSAVKLCAMLLDLVLENNHQSSPEKRLKKVFLCDSGSIAVEVAMKMCIQAYSSSHATRKKFVTFRGGYHGDTFGAMSVCDPINGMHKQIFDSCLMNQIFIDAPACGGVNQCWEKNRCVCTTSEQLISIFKTRREEIAGVIIEPILQGAGGMNVYSPHLLRQVRSVCDENDALLICDEIATGFGRLGEVFACDFAQITPDIMCIGKGLTGGYVTMGATLVNDKVCKMITQPFMHGPTFMANPLACSVAIASIELLKKSNWKLRVRQIESIFKQSLLPLKSKYPSVVLDARVLGAVGVVELKQEISLQEKNQMTNLLLTQCKVWLRPFGRFIYTMPPFNSPITDDEVRAIVSAIDCMLEFLVKKETVQQQPNKEEKAFV